MAMNKNTVLAWATVLMIIMGVVLILMGAYRYDDVAGPDCLSCLSSDCG